MLTVYTEQQRDAWKRIARAQGLVCHVCLEPPALHRRNEFYNPGLCRACAAELDTSEPSGIDRQSAPPSLA